MRTECPKCGGSAGYERTHCDLILKCLCGYRKVVFTTLGEAEITHCDTQGDIRLPKEGTRFRKTLMVLSVLEEGTSAEVAQRLQEVGVPVSVSDASSYLMLLQIRGLVFKTVDRRTIAGGSSWALTDAAQDLLNV